MSRPNVLILMADQLIGRAIDPDGPAVTPAFDALCRRGTRIPHAYAANPVCSPSRASMMTGLLPHNHGVLCVTHTADRDQNRLREEHPHFAQRLRAAGYRTGYVGKWHVEHSEDPSRFGWDWNASSKSERWKQIGAQRAGEMITRHDVEGPEGYTANLLYGTTSTPVTERFVGVTEHLGHRFLDQALDGDEPWCLMLSCIEPHDPFVCGETARAHYDADTLTTPPNWADDNAGKPGLYRKAARCFDDMSDDQRREALACYYGAVTEIDLCYGRILARLEAAGALDDTIVVLTSDHGEFLGAHGLYCKNISAYEEAYEIPMVVAGPGIAAGVPEARVGLHDLAPTLCELCTSAAIDHPDSRSFAQLLADHARADGFRHGYAESFGGRVLTTQRVVWDGDWKLVFNGFDEDELYHLGEDPGELRNRIDDPAAEATLRALYAQLWQRVEATGDHSLGKMHYPGLRVARFGPDFHRAAAPV